MGLLLFPNDSGMLNEGKGQIVRIGRLIDGRAFEGIESFGLDYCESGSNSSQTAIGLGSGRRES